MILWKVLNTNIIYDDNDGVHIIGCDENLSCDGKSRAVAFQAIDDLVYLFDEKKWVENFVFWAFRGKFGLVSDTINVVRLCSKSCSP